VCFLSYSLPTQEETNPNWPAIGYQPLDPEVRARHTHPEDKKILPLNPESDLTLDCDVCVIGSGAGGSVVAATLSEQGKSVVVLEAGEYMTVDDSPSRSFR
jgi:NADPH-dependent 2,4-dienoyl-CoA reductase/sulfur reductase-like enzyme